MYAAERHQQIVGRAHSEGRVDVKALAETLDVAPETVRRDLSALARLGMVRRVHGGAVPVHGDPVRSPMTPGDDPVGGERARIAVRALEELTGTRTIAVAGGPVTVWLARSLPAASSLTVVTSSLLVAVLLAPRPGITVHVLGGTVRPRTLATVGEWVAQALAEISVDVAVIGAHGLTVGRGLTTTDPVEATAQRGLVRAASRTVVLADRLAVGHDDVAHVVPVDAVDVVVTGTGVADEVVAEVERVGTRLVRA